VSVDLSEVRRRAWATRREKYGVKGHSGAYYRPTDSSVEPMRRLIAKLTNEGIISEGQGSKVTGLYRIQYRDLCIKVRDEEEQARSLKIAAAATTEEEEERS
jgi:hypothetical protein